MRNKECGAETTVTSCVESHGEENLIVRSSPERLRGKLKKGNASQWTELVGGSSECVVGEGGGRMRHGSPGRGLCAALWFDTQERAQLEGSRHGSGGEGGNSPFTPSSQAGSGWVSRGDCLTACFRSLLADGAPQI